MVKEWGRKVSKFFLIPQRYVLAIMAFLAIVNAYTMRVSLSVAITEMVVHPNKSSPKPNTTARSKTDCAGEVGEFVPTVNDPNLLYDWDEEKQGIILSSFYWGYLLTHLPGGILSERFGGKYTLGIGLLITAVLTLLTPVIITSSKGNWAVLVAVRVAEGLGEGVTYPAINVLVANWTPLLERGRLGSLVFAGSQIGTIVSNMISGGLIKTTKHWASVFYLFGGLGVLWFLLWLLLCYSNPGIHPFITDKEKDFLFAELGNLHDRKNRAIPWKHIMTSAPMWALICAQIGHDWGFYTMVTDLPKYLKDVLKFNVADNGLYSSLPYAVMWIVSISSGWFCDWLIKKGYMGLTVSRKLWTSIAAVGPALFIMAASYSGCNRTMAVVFFTISMGTMGSYYCGMKVNALDLSPHFAGTLMAITNGIGAITGIITPYLVGALTPDRTVEKWQLVFWISFGIFVSTTIVYCIFASGEQQWWSEGESTEETTTTEPEKN